MRNEKDVQVQQRRNLVTRNLIKSYTKYKTKPKITQKASIRPHNNKPNRQADVILKLRRMHNKKKVD